MPLTLYFLPNESKSMVKAEGTEILLEITQKKN